MNSGRGMIMERNPSRQNAGAIYGMPSPIQRDFVQNNDPNPVLSGHYASAQIASQDMLGIKTHAGSNRPQRIPLKGAKNNLGMNFVATGD